jgi:hypothetical protein
MSYKQNDFVLFANPDKKRQVGKITTIQKDSFFICNVYARPEAVLGQRQSYHSHFELIRTEETAKEFLSNVIRKVEVLRLQEFKARFENPVKDILGDDSQLYSKLENFAELFPSDFYFFRQKYANHQLLPELKPVCVCQKVFNADEEYSYCPKCKEPFHPVCIR